MIFWQDDETRPYKTPTFRPSTDYVQGGFQREHTPIVIDHGAWQVRAGWASEQTPRLQFDNLVAKVRGGAADGSVDILVGQDLLGAGAAERSAARSAMDSNTSVVVHPEMLQHVLDYTFRNLGIRGDVEEPSVQHPVVMTETLCNPGASRAVVSELLFECYGVPSVMYGVDSAFSYFYNQGGSMDRSGLVISSGYHATHILPIFDARLQPQYAQRITVAGTQTTDFMHKLLQLKYPSFPAKFTPNQAQWMVHEFGYVAEDYLEELRGIERMETLDLLDRTIQFPFVAPEEKSAEEREELERRKEQQRQRMRDQLAKQQEAKLRKKEEQLAEYRAIAALNQPGSKQEFKRHLLSFGFKTEADWQASIDKLQLSITKSQNKMMGLPPPEEPPKQPPTFPLVDIPDSQLTDEQKREKRKQRLLKAGHDAREKARAERELARAKQVQEEEQEEQRRLADPQAWVHEMRQKRLALIKRIREKEKHRHALSDRKSVAAQARMKAIAALAAEEAVPSSSGKRRKKTEEDTFGADDADWMIYREISKEEESEDDDDDDQQQLQHYEQLLIQHDPDFLPEETLDLEERKQQLYYRLRYGETGYVDTNDPAQHYQIHLNVERARVPEILFQPYMVGVDQAGISELLALLLPQLDQGLQAKMVENILLTGTHTLFPGMEKRVARDVQMMMPVGTKVQVKRARDPRLDAWKGAAMWARQDTKRNAFMTRAEWLDCGPEWAKEHGLWA